MSAPRGLEDDVDRIASETRFEGVIRVDRGEDIVLARAFGSANRERDVLNSIDTRFGVASGTKGLTALTVMSLIEDGTLSLTTTARALLGKDLPLVDNTVTVEQLLAHRSGIGDYFDEDVVTNPLGYEHTVPVSELETTEDYLRVLDGHPMKFTPDARFSYCNSGYVVLALVAERASGKPFYDLVAERVTARAGMADTAFLRSDALPPDTALGYLRSEGSDTNASHLPVCGSGDGGIYTTAADVRALWLAIFDGRIVPGPAVHAMMQPRSAAHGLRYGLGFWVHTSRDVAILEGADAGVSFRSVHDPDVRLTHTVLSNVTDAAWGVSRYLSDALTP